MHAAGLTVPRAAAFAAAVAVFAAKWLGVWLERQLLHGHAFAVAGARWRARARGCRVSDKEEERKESGAQY